MATYHEICVENNIGMTSLMFASWLQRCPILSTLLGDVLLASAIQLKLKPKFPQEEKSIVTWLWLQNDISAPSIPWYIIASTWWQLWCTYVDMSVDVGTPEGSLPIPRFLNSKKYKGIEIRNMSDIVEKAPTRISNWLLLKQSGSRDMKEDLRIGIDFHVGEIISQLK